MNGGNCILGWLEHFANRENRNYVTLVPPPHHQPVDDGERKRQLQQEGRSLSPSGSDIDAPPQLLNVLAHHVHAYTAARNIRNLFGGVKARMEDQVEDLAVGQGSVL